MTINKYTRLHHSTFKVLVHEHVPAVKTTSLTPSACIWLAPCYYINQTNYPCRGQSIPVVFYTNYFRDINRMAPVKLNPSLSFAWIMNFDLLTVASLFTHSISRNYLTSEITTNINQCGERQFRNEVKCIFTWNYYKDKTSDIGSEYI